MNDLPLINFRSLRCLREVKQSGSFTEAASALGISQPALSHSLAELAKRLGVKLFDAHGRRRVLTKVGEEVALYAEKVLGDTSELVRHLKHWDKGVVGTLRVGMIDTASLYTIPKELSRFREEYPDVDLQLVVDESAPLLSRLDRYEIDLALVVGSVGDRYESERITTEEMHVYSKNPISESSTGSYSHLSSDTSWALYPSGSRTRGIIDHGLAELGVVNPEVALESGHPTVLRQMAALGHAFTVLPSQVADARDLPLALVRGPLVAKRKIDAVWRSGQELDKRAQLLLELAGSENNAKDR